MNEFKVINLLKEYDDAYYNQSESLIEDPEYDKLKQKAKKLFSKNLYFKSVGAKPQKISWKVKEHSIVMGSIDNILSDGDIFSIESVLANAKKWWEKLGKPDLLCQHKLDGVSIDLEYEYGMLFRGILRGDGQEGEDIFMNVISMKNVRRFIPESFSNIHGEIILSKKALEKINLLQEQSNDKFYANCRNAASGICRRLDAKYSQFLKIIPFDYRDEDSTYDSTKINNIPGMEFVDSLVTNDWEKVENYYKTILKKRDKLPYCIDGIVIKINHLDLRTDTSETPDWIRALKFPPEEKLFKVDKIKWFIGKTGKCTPVAHNTVGVQFQDKIIHEVTIHNYSYFCRYKLAPQDKISVVISGDVIPKCNQVEERSGNPPFEAPKICPECNSLLRVESKFLFCDSKGCPGRVKSLLNAHIKEMQIDEVGTELISKLYEMGQKNEIQFNDMADFYILTLRDILKVPGYKEKSAGKVIDNIHAKMETDIPTLISSLGIPNVGKKIIKKINPESIDQIYKMSLQQLKEISGIGSRIAVAIKNGMDENYHLIEKLFSNGIKIKGKKKVTKVSNILNGKSVCFTGNCQVLNPGTRETFSREECQEFVVSYGGVVKSGVSGKLDILVLADMSSQSTKARKAQELGTQLMSCEEFFERIGAIQ